MTNQENQIVEKLGDIWNLFLKLPIEHVDDVDEFRHHIHILQRQVMARPTRRALDIKPSLRDDIHRSDDLDVEHLDPDKRTWYYDGS